MAKISINKRVFGSDIDDSIKKKLAIKQDIAEGKSINEALSNTIAKYNISEVQSIGKNISQLANFVEGPAELNSDEITRISAELSAKTPFTRLWCGLERKEAELYEGSVWESLMYISHHNLTNLRIIIDRNGLGTIGETEKMLKLEPLADKMKSFMGDVVEIDGHSYYSLRGVFSSQSPQVIIAKTTKGKGVSYMEGKWQYHTIVPSSEEDIKIGLENLS